jgi:LytS/YehU family sensor histidine kinase
MNLISALILESRNEEAVKVVAEFSKLQRTYLETNNKDQISLQEELDFLGIYLKLQQRRFDINNRFEYKIEIETTDDISSISVPPLILQPIAENAIKHGIIGSTSSEKWIHVDISSDEKNIIINIEDNGDFKKTNFDLGMGQKLVLQRIEIYNKINRKKLSVVSGLHPRFSNTGYRVELKIPIGGKV